MVIVSLVEEHILSILDLVVDCVLFKDARWTNPVLLAQLFPELATDYGYKLSSTLIAALADLDRDNLSRHCSVLMIAKFELLLLYI